MKQTELKGIITPILTPMNADESINTDELRTQIDRLIDGGVHGIFPFGTNGEGYILNEKEKCEVLEAAIDQVKGRVPVYAGSGCISTQDTIRMSKEAEKLGADVLSIITPSFAVASQKELYDHYVEVAKHVDTPIVLYNIPARTGNKLLPETVKKLAKDVDLIIGAKDSSGDWDNLKNLIEAQNEMCKGNWEIRGAKKAFELEGKTVGILGLGAIGRETAKICKGCGMRIAAYDPFMTKEQVEGYGAKYYEDYVELLKDSDVVSIHVPLTDQTRNMISKKELSVMKPTALIINCSRGGIINEADLVEALNNGVIAGAGTDVFCSEPPKTDDPLLNCRNLIVSPHSAAQTREAVIKMAQMCIKGCLAVVEGKKWPYVADKSVYEHEKWKGADWAEI